MLAQKSRTRLPLIVLAAVLFAVGWLVGVLCAAAVWVGTAVKVGWVDGWRGVSRGPAG